MSYRLSLSFSVNRETPQHGFHSDNRPFYTLSKSTVAPQLPLRAFSLAKTLITLRVVEQQGHHPLSPFCAASDFMMLRKLWIFCLRERATGIVNKCIITGGIVTRCHGGKGNCIKWVDYEAMFCFGIQGQKNRRRIKKEKGWEAARQLCVTW